MNGAATSAKAATSPVANDAATINPRCPRGVGSGAPGSWRSRSWVVVVMMASNQQAMDGACGLGEQRRASGVGPPLFSMARLRRPGRSAEAQPVEPGGPSGVEVALEADLVPSGPVVIAGRCVAHGAPSMVHAPDLGGVADVSVA